MTDQEILELKTELDTRVYELAKDTGYFGPDKSASLYPQDGKVRYTLVKKSERLGGILLTRNHPTASNINYLIPVEITHQGFLPLSGLDRVIEPAPPKVDVGGSLRTKYEAAVKARQAAYDKADFNTYGALDVLIRQLLAQAKAQSVDTSMWPDNKVNF